MSRFANLVNVVNELELSAVRVANRLRPVLLRLARELRREVHPLGVTGGQVTLLVQIRRHAGIGVRELAAREGISAAGMSGHVSRLERAGLVERRADAGDLRRHGLHLTAEGERVLRLVRSRRTAWLAERMKGLSPDELRALDEAIEPLERILGEPR
jgi:DNA-binding MarR family transcriptional regulator